MIARPHCRTKHQVRRFPPFFQLTYGREKWKCDPRSRRFGSEAEARAFLSGLRRRQAKGGAVIAKLEFRDGYGIWHELALGGESR